MIEGGVRRKPETNVVRNGRRCGGGGCRTVDSGKHAVSVFEGVCRLWPETNVVRNGRRCGGGCSARDRFTGWAGPETGSKSMFFEFLFL